MNARKVLEQIEANGFEAYIIGGYVRDYLLGIESSDIDICTNARVKDLLEIFKNNNVTSNEYGSIKIMTDKYRIDITTYRKDIKYNGNRKDVEIEYVNNLIDDINRRDFTINTICMNKENHIIDILNGQKDLNNKIIRCIGESEKRLTEDPLRILRAIRFATILDFTIEESLYHALIKNSYLLKKLSKEKIKEELTKILINKNALKGLRLLKETDCLSMIRISYNKDMVYVSDICGMYSQLTLPEEFPFSKEEKENIKAIQNIINYGKIDEHILFLYGLYISQVAGSILNIDKEDIANINKNLPIKSFKEIKITSDEICVILNSKPNKIIGAVYDKLKDLILERKLMNDNIAIKEYIKQNRGVWLNEKTTI